VRCWVGDLHEKQGGRSRPAAAKKNLEGIEGERVSPTTSVGSSRGDRWSSLRPKKMEGGGGALIGAGAREGFEETARTA
jgi:hypothetical protein